MTTERNPPRWPDFPEASKCEDVAACQHCGLPTLIHPMRYHCVACGRIICATCRQLGRYCERRKP